jgi:mannan endo-1,4-beta-mannosidase
MKNSILTGLFVTLCFGISLGQKKTNQLFQLSDPLATKETQALFFNLGKLSQTNVMIGHQDDMAYGVGWRGIKDKSDIKDVSGSYPAVFGWDISKIGKELNIDSVPFVSIRQWIAKAYGMNCVNTISWHEDNPVTKNNAWDPTSAVAAIIPGGKFHDYYKSRLDEVAGFLGSLKSDKGEMIPVIFRPFHEHSGGWFWWGKGNCTANDFISLWRFTVDYLRKEKGLHNLIVSFSTDVFNSPEEFLSFYPGDEYVDMLGFDDYQSVKSYDGVETLAKRLRMIVKIAESKGKIPAMTETGLESVPMADWWTNILLKAIKTDEVTKRISYVLVWRNYTTKHHYAPYPGQTSVSDFLKFKTDPLILFQDKMPEIYHLN